VLRLADAFAEEEVETSSLSDIFEEEPVPLNVFVEDGKFLRNPPLSPVQFEAVKHIERVYLPEIYPLMAEEFGGYWSDPVRMTNLITLQWGKGCISKNEDIYDARTGRWSKISSVNAPPTVEGTYEVNSDGDTTHLPGQAVFTKGTNRVLSEGSVPFFRGRGQMVKVTTALGASIEVYAGHLFASWADHNLPYKNRYLRAEPVWQQAASLQAGDRIATLSKIDCLEPVSQDEREVALVGYWIGDGSMPVDGSTSWGFYIDAQATELLETYIDLVESYPGITAKTSIMDSGALRVRATTTGSGRKFSTPLIDVIRKWGLYGSRAWDKRVPDEFFSLPDDQLAIFLSALWDTDGSIYLKKAGTKSLSPCFEYVSVSEGLARDIQRLLLRFGVISRLSSKTPTYTYRGEKKTGRTAWRVTVTSGKFAVRLASVLRLHGPKEALRLVSLDWNYANEQQKTDGDVYWDTVKSVEFLGEDEYWDINVPEGGSYVAGSTALISSNSGKDHVCRVASLRVAYMLLCLKSPQKYYSMPEQDSIHLLNIASNSQQAMRAFFKPMSQAVKRGWFSDKADPTQNAIQYAKNIEAVSGHSEAEGQEGLNIMLGVADEIDAFKSKGEMVGQGKKMREASTSAESILDMLKTSASTRFPMCYKRVAISFPRYLGSTIQNLTEEAKEDYRSQGPSSIYYVSGPLATWDVNPRVEGKHQFATDYRKAPDEAAAKYECKPTRATDAYFRNPEIFRIAVDSPTQPISVDYRLEEHLSEQTGSLVKSWEPVFTFAPDFVPKDGALYAIHGDLAIRGDRAGVAMSHVVRTEERTEKVIEEDGEVTERSQMVEVLRNDFTISLEADLGESPPREIQIRWLRRLVFDLIKRGFSVRLVTLDGFQSVDTMQTLTNHGIETALVSTDRDSNIWKTVKDVASEGRLSMPHSALLQKELEALSRVGNGKIDHPVGGSKDLADAFACSLVDAIQIGGSEGGGVEILLGENIFETGGEVSLYGMDDELLDLSGLMTGGWIDG